MLGNLQGGVSRGCGCRSKSDGLTQRVNVPWTCAETGQRFETTRALSKHLGINNMVLMRKLNRCEVFVASDGNNWIPLKEEATPHMPGMPARAWACIDTGETWPSARALAEHLGIQGNQLHTCAREQRTYCGADRRHYVPVGMEHLTRSKFVPRIGSRKPKAA